jgi:hypothetical protein
MQASAVIYSSGQSGISIQWPSGKQSLSTNR